MVFSSIEFLYFFFPIFLLVYYVVPAKGKNFWLFAGSLLFYAIGSIKKPEHIALFAASLILNYLFGRWIERSGSKVVFGLGVGINIVYFAVFKYLLGILPIGISFYTFQAISYLFDVWWKKCSVEKNFINYLLQEKDLT